MKSTFAAAAALGLAVFSAGAQASVVMSISEVGSDVVAMASGTLNLGGLSFSSQDNGALNAFVFPSFAAVGVGPAPSDTDVYRERLPARRLWDRRPHRSIQRSWRRIRPERIPPNCYSFLVTTFLDLRFPLRRPSPARRLPRLEFRRAHMCIVGVPGSTLTRSQSTSRGAVPEPSTWAMMGLGFAALGFVSYRARRSAVSIA